MAGINSKQKAVHRSSLRHIPEFKAAVTLLNLFASNNFFLNFLMLSGSFPCKSIRYTIDLFSKIRI